jgi:auxin response factor
MFLTDGIGASDFGESLRFQKVLQGQEIMGYTPYDGIDTQNQHPSETRRCFPGSNGSVIAGTGDGVRNPVLNSDISYKGTGFGESYRFHKVLQGQEIFPSSPYGRAPPTNESHDNGGLGIFDGVQVLNSRKGWSAMIQGNSTHMRPSAPSMQVSSPSSVLMFQQAINPVSNLSSVYNFNNLEGQRTSHRNVPVSETVGSKFTSSSLHEHSVGRKDQGGMNSSGCERNQLGISLPPFANRSTFGGSQDLVSSCKSSCRLFGFSLTEEKDVANAEDNPTPVSLSLNPGASFLPACWGPVPSKTSVDDQGNWKQLYQSKLPLML